MWTVPREWPGSTVFIVGGGPSVVTQDTDALQGRRVIVVNSSYLRCPFADVLFFGDSRWWFDGHQKGTQSFPGRIVTLGGIADPRISNLRRYDLKVGLSLKPDGLVMGRTSLQAAINLAVLYGATRVVLLGADMGAAPDGTTHHHKPHRWALRPNCWNDQMRSLRYSVEPLKAAGVEVLNASPVSRINWWPKIDLSGAL